jgi:ferrous iron transport protein A
MVDGTESPAHGPKSGSLASAAIGARVRIIAAQLDEDVSAWLAAVGLHEGEEVTVLRRAAFGGPLHVRTSSGGEFAVAKELAARLDVSVVNQERS